jgi:hypothetical protein
MKQKDNHKSLQKAEDEKANGIDTILYPPDEDIYNRSKKEAGIDPEDTSAVKQLDETYNEAILKNKDDSKDIFERDLDVPGSELDDEQEKIGSEDEENNYYSLGLDNHNELEENNE